MNDILPLVAAALVPLVLGGVIGAIIHAVATKVDRRDCQDYMSDTEATIARLTAELQNIKRRDHAQGKLLKKAGDDLLRMINDRDGWRERAQTK